MGNLYSSKRWLSLEDLNGEVWRKTEYPHLLVSNYGRLKREMHQTKIVRNGKKPHIVLYNERIYVLSKDKCGYVRICLTSKGKRKPILVHRLVAIAFLPNPQKLPYVNHKDESKDNNFVFVNSNGSVDEDRSNLEWCTFEYNLNYKTCQKRHADSLRKVLRPRCKVIKQYTLDGVLVAEYRGKTEVENAGFVYTTVTRSCRHFTKTSQGYVWRYDDDPFSHVEYNYDTDSFKKPVMAYDLHGNFVEEYFGLKEAANRVGGKPSSISRCCLGKRKSAYGYIWRYK